MIPQGITINGNMEGAGHLIINGTVRGNVNIKGRLEIGVQGSVDGDLRAEELLVVGAVKGNIYCSSKLLLRSGCRVTGNLLCAGLIMEEGAWLKGRCQMGRQNQTPISAPGATSGKSSNQVLGQASGKVSPQSHQNAGPAGPQEQVPMKSGVLGSTSSESTPSSSQSSRP
ncbi:MAG: polymer-forming cytoskeletal protein [Candidatus Eisenbacteria bacterium]|uniref:Polymer-forming cytoskeletal protein n=1 Tax=Eiseniibacteriota bacterium TaxID=2212470 RepID=A0A948S3V3_UNCEI|nr:polymer-forming cytoskeletal protein [Candidatus Eisenbacteria bacterium]MBU1947252.1 polymer-forming cytoskeletal protein [Candidatus Eisenbacteria bacterium]MBU2693334.1 polymer-forming cytoskeletal protein [Candidatus Eisenbacteria bacterium]